MLFVEMTDCKYPTKKSFCKLAGIHGKNKGNGPFLFVLYTVGNKTQSDVNRRSVETEICIYFFQIRINFQPPLNRNVTDAFSISSQDENTVAAVL